MPSKRQHWRIGNQKRRYRKQYARWSDGPTRLTPPGWEQLFRRHTYVRRSLRWRRERDYHDILNATACPQRVYGLNLYCFTASVAAALNSGSPPSTCLLHRAVRAHRGQHPHHAVLAAFRAASGILAFTGLSKRGAVKFLSTSAQEAKSTVVLCPAG